MLDHYRSWLEKKPGDRLAMYGLALELKKAGQIDAAIEAFESLLTQHPTSGAGWLQFGQLYEDGDDEDRAKEIWEQGLEALADAQGTEAARSRSEIEAALALL